MITTKIVSDERRCNNVRIRITNNRRKAELATDMYLSPLDLDLALSPNPPKRLERLAHVLAYWQKQLDALKMEIYRDGGRCMDVAEIKERVAEKLFGRVRMAAECRLGVLYRNFAASRRGQSTRDNYKVSLRALSRFAPDAEKMNIQDIDYKFVRRYAEWLSAQGYREGTVTNYLNKLHAVILEAIRDEVADRDPFLRLRRTARTTKPRKRSLSAEALREIFAIQPVGKKSAIALDAFKLSFMLVGINMADLLKLDRVTDGRIDYERCKTGRQYSIKVEPEAMEIINRYKSDKRGQLLTFADVWSHRTGASLAVKNALRKHTGRDDLTQYWARHSWATIAYSIGISKDVISQSLGHSFGVAVTDVYIDYDNAKVDEANRRVLDWVLYGKR